MTARHRCLMFIAALLMNNQTIAMSMFEEPEAEETPPAEHSAAQDAATAIAAGGQPAGSGSRRLRGGKGKMWYQAAGIG